MSGHSKWATTKRQKAVVDAKRGAIFTKLGNLISIVARKGGDPETNFSLRIAVDKARAANMPKENIERAVKRGTGELGGGQIEELVYEGIGPAQSQFIVKCLTDNRNRAAANVRHLFAKAGGSLGSVAWNFEMKGVIMISTEIIDQAKLNWDEFELELIDTGADDIIKEDEGVTIYTKVENLQKVKLFLDTKKIITESAQIDYVAKEKLKLDNSEDKEKLENFINALDEDEDVSDYYTNATV